MLKKVLEICMIYIEEVSKMKNDIFVERLTALVDEKIEFERDRESDLMQDGEKKEGRKHSFNRSSIAKDLEINYTTFLGYLKTEMSGEKKSEKIPSGKTLVALAEYFKVSVDYLLGLSNAPTQDVTVNAISEYTGLSVEAIECLHRGQVLRNGKFEQEQGIYSHEYMMKVVNNFLERSRLLYKMEQLAFQTDANRSSLEIYKKLEKDDDENPYSKYVQAFQNDGLKKDLVVYLFETTKELEQFFEENFGTSTLIREIEAFGSKKNK